MPKRLLYTGLPFRACEIPLLRRGRKISTHHNQATILVLNEVENSLPFLGYKTINGGENFWFDGEEPGFKFEFSFGSKKRFALFLPTEFFEFPNEKKFYRLLWENKNFPNDKARATPAWVTEHCLGDKIFMVEKQH